MGDPGVLLELGEIVVGAALVLAIARRLALPPLISYLVAGLLLGPLTGLLIVTESVDLLSHFGVALLLFLVGMEMSVERIREVGRTSLLVAGGQMAATMVGGTALAALLGFPVREALLLGLAVIFSSTVVVIKLLDRAGDLEERYGRISVGVLLVQDVVVALALTVIAGLGAGADGSMAVQLGAALLGLVALVAGAAAAVRWGLGELFGWLAPSREAVFIAVLAWCLGFILVAESVHLSVELGAFVAGVAVAQLPQAGDLHTRVRPLVDFLLAVFFVTLGAGMDLGAVSRNAGAVLALSAFVIVLKPVLVGGLLELTGEARSTGVGAGLTLGQISEFSFVLVGGAAAAGIGGQEVVSVTTAVGLTTIAASAVLAPRADRVTALLEAAGWGGQEASGSRPGEGKRFGHVVVVGMNTLGRALVEGLTRRSVEVVAVDTDPEKLRDVSAETVVGDVSLRDIMADLDIDSAKLLVSALRIEDTNRLLVYRCVERETPVAVHAFDPLHREELRSLGADYVIDSKREGVRQITGRLRLLADEKGIR